MTRFSVKKRIVRIIFRITSLKKAPLSTAHSIKKRKHCPYKPGSVPPIRMASVIYLVYESPHSSSVLPSIVESGGQPSDDGLRELAAPSRHSPMITHRLVVSYTTFSPLPHQSKAVIFFCPHLLSPIASTFRSGVPYAARTFLLCRNDTSDRP